MSAIFMTAPDAVSGRHASWCQPTERLGASRCYSANHEPHLARILNDARCVKDLKPHDFTGRIKVRDHPRPNLVARLDGGLAQADDHRVRAGVIGHLHVCRSPRRPLHNTHRPQRCGRSCSLSPWVRVFRATTPIPPSASRPISLLVRSPLTPGLRMRGLPGAHPWLTQSSDPNTAGYNAAGRGVR